VASDTGYRFPTARFKPRISAEADISSGDNPNSKTLGTFNALFPKGTISEPWLRPAARTYQFYGSTHGSKRLCPTASLRHSIGLFNGGRT